MYAFALAVRERVDSAPDESGRTVWPGRDCALRFEDEDLPDDAAGAGISKIQLYVVSLFTRVWFSARGCSATWRCRVRASQTFPFPRRKSSRSGCCGSSTAASREHQLSIGFWLSFCVSAGGRQNCRARQQRECVHLREHTGQSRRARRAFSCNSKAGRARRRAGSLCRPDHAESRISAACASGCRAAETAGCGFSRLLAGEEQSHCAAEADEPGGKLHPTAPDRLSAGL